MLAKFENGYFLEICEESEKTDKNNEFDTNECVYLYSIYDDDYDFIDSRFTEQRDIELYYPMNLIDYILEFCEPDDLKGMKNKYEILEYNTMKEFLKSIEEDPNGKWILERKGTRKCNIRHYKSEEAARLNALKEIKDFLDDDLDEDELKTFNDNGYFEYGCEYRFESWNIYKDEYFDNKKDYLLNEIEKELSRANIGVSQYSHELEDTYVIYNHLEKIEKLLNSLKEVI